MKFRSLLTALCVAALAATSMSLEAKPGGGGSGFGGGARTAAPTQARVSTPATVSQKPAAASGFGGGSRSTSTETAKAATPAPQPQKAAPVVPQGATNQAFAQQIQKSAAADAWNSRKKVVAATGAAAGVAAATSSMHSGQQVPSEPVAQAQVPSGYNNQNTGNSGYVIRKEVTVVHQNSGNDGMLTGVLLGQAMSRNSQAPVVVYPQQGTVQAPPAQVGESGPGYTASTSNTVPSGESSGVGAAILKVLFWASLLGGVGWCVYWLLNRRQEAANHKPTYSL
jgi:hypothetical protein